MILFALRPHATEAAPAWPGAALRSWRWALVAKRWSLEAEEQVKRGSEAWCPAVRYVGVYLSSPPRVGYDRFYHNGPHHSLWLGWLNIGWSKDGAV